MKKLKLNKQTISLLNDNAKKSINGGKTGATLCNQNTCAYTCPIGCIPDSSPLGMCDVDM